jgi:phosphoribosylformylglycinamidine synthase subunit PurS
MHFIGRRTFGGPGGLGMYVARVKIGLKKGVTDPEGNNTLKALRLLGFPSIEHVSTERIVRLRVNAKKKEEAVAEAEKACRRLLTNPVIHEYKIEVEESK